MSSNQRLPRSAPEAQGIASSAILALVEALEHNVQSVHSLMIVRHGHVVAEGWWAPYAPELPHMLYSLSKSFTSTAIGLAVEEGRLSVNDKVISFFPDDLPAEVSENLAAMRVHDLLAMATGHSLDTTPALRQDGDGNWVRAFLAQPVEHEPGTHFVYNSGATYMLSAILQKLVGERMLDYLQPRLFAPLGIETPTWEQSPQGIDTGGWGLNITTEDIACFGQMYLQQGVWRGEPIVPSTWVAEATRAQVANPNEPNPDWTQGYGYQFWRCRHNAYRGDGAFGQFCVVIPEHDTVLAITSGLKDMQAVLDQVWAVLLPALQDAPLADDAAASRQLGDTLSQLQLSPLGGTASPRASTLANGQTYRFDSNDLSIETLALSSDGGDYTLNIADDQGTHQIRVGNGTWRTNETTFTGLGSSAIAASGAWTADDTYTVRLCMYKTPYCPTVTFQFAGDDLRVEATPNVSFGPLEGPKLVGHRG